MKLQFAPNLEYQKEYYAQEIFKEQELAGYLNQNLQESRKGVYDYVIYDSDVEKNFAISFENNQDE
jgi:type III restriction enzyme